MLSVSLSTCHKQWFGGRAKEHVAPQRGSIARNDLLLTYLENDTSCVPKPNIDRDLRQGAVRARMIMYTELEPGVYARRPRIEVVH